ncbi:hypothetical protein ACE193_24445 [Bernardetia sp. OM2101]|uniref:hypothetical protein n=1 Tax=Bernardetia sp. OM2101 TaxID=3344876 RepID=UPI0035CF6F42
MENILYLLRQYEFHDLCVEHIRFIDNDTKVELSIVILPFNEERDDYDRVELYFSDILNLKTTELHFTSNSCIEINSFDYKWNEIFIGKFIFTQGFGESCFLLEIECDNVEITEK